MNPNTPDPGIYRRYQPHTGSQRPAVFLDRDGVIVEETGYLHKVEDVVMIPDVAAAIAHLNAAGLPVIVITNQAGVGRGYYSWYQFEAVQYAIEQRLAQLNAHLDGVWACGYHPEGQGELATDHPFRKPHPGMLLDAAASLAIDLRRSFVIGDKALDVQAGLNAGVRSSILVRTGYGRQQEALLPARPEVHVVETLQQAVDNLILPSTRL